MRWLNERGLAHGPARTAVLITLLLMSNYLFIATRSTLWDRDEPRYARATVEMVESGNYLVPTFNGQIWADKPVMLYWVMSVPVRLLGPTEFACRFFGIVGSAVTCVLMFFIASWLLCPKAGLWSMVILASTTMLLVIGTAATPDAVLLPFVVAAMAVFVRAVSSGTNVLETILLGAALGAGMLTKGPIGVLPVPAIVLTLWLDRKNRPDIRRCMLHVGAAFVLGVLIFASWAVPANNSTGGEFLHTFIGRHVLSRAMKPMEHHGGNFLLYLPYYLGVIIVGFFPWTLHLPGALSAVLRGRVGGRRCRALLIGWLVPAFVMMTLAATKLPHYILFIWPGLALAVAGTIVAARQNTLAEQDRIWLRRGVWFFGPPAIIGALGLMVGPWLLPVNGLRWFCVASGIVLSAMAVIAIREQLADRPQVSAGVLLVGMLVLEIPLLFGVLPEIERMKISPLIAKAVTDKTGKDVPVVTYKYGEPTLNFYIGRRIESLRSEEALVAWAQQPQAGVLIIPRAVLDGIQQRHGPLALGEIASKKGLNYSKGAVLEVMALVRRPGNL